jgi:TPR repeat protein
MKVWTALICIAFGLALVWMYNNQLSDPDAVAQVVRNESPQGRPSSEGASERTYSSLSEVEAWAKEGDIEAINQLVWMHYEGHLTPKNHLEAFRWANVSSDMGDPQGKFMLALLYQEGAGVEENRVKAIRLLRETADKGHGSAMVQLAFAYYEGKGVEVNQAEAVKWLRSAAEANVRSAQSLLAAAYLAGDKGVQRDLQSAYVWLQMAKKNGVEEAEEMLDQVEQELSNEERRAAYNRALRCISSEYQDC